MLCAALTPLAGTFGSMIIFPRAETAAEDICWSRAVDWEKAGPHLEEGPVILPIRCYEVVAGVSVSPFAA
jgi:hypothetical protein